MFIEIFCYLVFVVGLLTMAYTVLPSRIKPITKILLFLVGLSFFTLGYDNIQNKERTPESKILSQELAKKDFF